MERALLFWACLWAFVPLSCLDTGGGEESESPGGVESGGTGSGAGDGTEGKTLSYSNGHPLNWLTDNQAVIDLEDRVHELVNNHRTALLKPQLVHMLGMRRCARGHSFHMRGASHDFFDHTNPEGDEPWHRMTKNAIPWLKAGENIAYGYTTPESVVSAWLASEGHRRNIEDGMYTRTGIGYQSGAPRGTYWTQIFAD